jgi:hypothetical protein
MRWQLAGDWPVGPAVIPAGTVLTGVVGPDGELSVSPPLTVPLPINAMALDDEAALQMCMWYDEAATIGGWHHLLFGPGIDHEAIKAQARHKKRWPNGMPTTSQSISERKDSTDAEVPTQAIEANQAQTKAHHKAKARRPQR